MSIWDSLEVGKRHVLELPQNQISEEGIKAVNAYLTETFIDRYRDLRNDYAEYEVWLNRDWSRDWVVGKGAYVGTFPKRVVNFLYKERQIKAGPAVSQQLGNLFNLHSSKHNTFEFDFVRKINWRAGEFGDSGSCYWGGNDDARKMLEDYGAYAIRFWNGTRGIGRAWLAPIIGDSDVHNEAGRPVAVNPEDVIVLFNGYGAYETIRIARILASFLGTSYKAVGIENQGKAGGTLWINHYRDGIHGGGRGFILGQPEEIGEISYIDLQYETPERFEYHCASCNEGLHSGDVYHGGNQYWCSDCYNDRFTRCERCDVTVDSEQTIDVEVNAQGHEQTWCYACANADASNCYNCENTVSDRIIELLDGEPYCPSCFEETASICETCEETYNINSGHECPQLETAE